MQKRDAKLENDNNGLEGNVRLHPGGLGAEVYVESSGTSNISKFLTFGLFL